MNAYHIGLIGIAALLILMRFVVYGKPGPRVVTCWEHSMTELDKEIQEVRRRENAA